MFELEKAIDGLESQSDKNVLVFLLCNYPLYKNYHIDKNGLKKIKNILDGEVDEEMKKNMYSTFEVLKFRSKHVDFNVLEEIKRLNTYKSLNHDIKKVSVEKFEKLLDECEQKYEVENINYDIAQIVSDKNKLIEYLKNIVQLESDNYSLKERYIHLLPEYNEVLNELFCARVKIDEWVEKEIVDIEHEISELTRKINIRPVLNEKVVVEKPRKIGEPQFTLSKPKEPIYQEPNFFNKKSVEKENEKLKLGYEEALRIYDKKYEEYKQSLIEFENTYENCVKSLQEQVKRKNKEEYENKLAFYNNNLEVWKNLLNEKHAKRLQMIENVENTKKEMLENEEIYKKAKALKYELNFITNNIERNIKLEKEFYSYNIVYGKYRNIIALSSFLDYLISGRCSTLTEKDGAYNLYEQESRADTIINKMDVIISSLSQIKENQYYIYNQLDSVKKSLTLINDLILVNNHLQTVEIEQLNSIIDKADQIAYNTKVASYYAKKNSNYSKALAFIQLLK